MCFAITVVFKQLAASCRYETLAFALDSDCQRASVCRGSSWLQKTECSAFTYVPLRRMTADLDREPDDAGQPRTLAKKRSASPREAVSLTTSLYLTSVALLECEPQDDCQSVALALDHRRCVTTPTHPAGGPGPGLGHDSWIILRHYTNRRWYSDLDCGEQGHALSNCRKQSLGIGITRGDWTTSGAV
jgi:hypothetical protein